MRIFTEKEIQSMHKLRQAGYWWENEVTKNCEICRGLGFSYGKDFEREVDRLFDGGQFSMAEAFLIVQKSSSDWKKCTRCVS